MLTRGVEWKRRESEESLQVALQQMFLNSADEKEDEVKSFTESYHKYKGEFLKHICFNPENENLSKLFVYFRMLI